MDKIDNSKYYLPTCPQKQCNGLLKIKINSYDFTINYKCMKNKSHRGDNIFFKTFERFYLKEREFRKCLKCSATLENECIYKCKKCGENFCTNCFVFHSHFKKNLNNLSQISNKCKIHNKELNNYCIDCQKKICMYCFNSNDSHEKHKIKYILDIMPSMSQINYLKDKINGKSKKINDFLEKLDEWKEKLLGKINNLKDSLRNELDLYKKMFINYNQFFADYYYYINFQNFYDDFDSTNNTYIDLFSNSKFFDEQTEILVKFIIQKNRKNKKHKEGTLKRLLKFSNNGIISKINNKYFFSYSDKTNTVEIDKYHKEKKGIYYLPKSMIDFQYKIESVSCSSITNRIYACLSNKLVVKIFEYDLKDKTMVLCEEEIKDDNSYLFISNFFKCIGLPKGFAATSDRDKISIWAKRDNNSKYYSNVKNINSYGKALDLLLINNNYFIAAHNYYNSDILVFYKTKNYKKSKILLDKCIFQQSNSLLKFKDYIIVNCFDGFALISIKSQELIQYRCNFKGYPNKHICIGNNDEIYIINSSYNKICIKKLVFKDGFFKTKEEYKQIQLNKKVGKFHNKEFRHLQMICVNNDDIIVWNRNIYILEEKDNDIIELKKTEKYINDGDNEESESEESKESNEDSDKNKENLTY